MTPSIIDLATIARVEFDGGPLGPLSIDVFSRDFAEWVKAGLSGEKWADGTSFARALLVEQARDPAREASAGYKKGAVPDIATLEMIAADFLRGSGVYFQPIYIADGAGQSRTVRRRAEAELEPIAPLPGETPTEHLLRVITAWVQDLRDFDHFLTQTSSPFATGALAAAGLASKGMASAGSASVGLASQSLLRDHQRLMDAVGVGASKVGFASALMRPHFDAVDALAKQVKSVTGMAGSLGRFEQYGLLEKVRADQRALAQSLSGLATIKGLDATAALSVYPNIGAEVARSLGLLGAARSRDTIGLAGLALAGLSGFSGDLARRVMSDNVSMASQLKKQFGLHVPSAALFASLSAASAMSAMAPTTVFPQGFQMAAALGVEDLAPGGVVADVLRRYGGEVPNAPVFTEALDSAALVDTGQASPEDAANFLIRFAYKVAALAGDEPEPVRRQAILAVYAFVFALLTLFMDMASTVASVADANYGRIQVEYARQADQVPALSPDATKDLAEAQARIVTLEASNRASISNDANIRYVHARANLRTEPRAGATPIRFIYPDQLLRVVDARGEWLLVEIVEYQSEATMRGWVSRRSVHVAPR